MLAESSPWPITIWTKYYRELLIFLTGKLRCPQEAEDMAQETFLRLLAVDNPTTIRQPRAFLYRIAKNLVVDWSRKRTVRSRHLVDINDLEEQSSNHPAPDQLAEKEQLYQALQKAIYNMPSRRRQVFILYRFGNATQADIAKELKISTSMVERHLMKAMEECRSKLQRFL